MHLENGFLLRDLYLTNLLPETTNPDGVISTTQTTKHMPEETASPAVAVVKAPLEEFGVIERNGISLTFHNTPFKRGDLKKDGTTYPYPDGLEDVPLANLIQFIGEDNVKGMIIPKFAQKSQDWMWQATPTDDNDKITGPMDADKFRQMVAEFSVVSESMADLKEKAEALTLKLPSVAPADLPAKIAELVNITNAIKNKKRTRSEKAAEPATA